MIRSIRHTFRLLRLAAILARHDALFPLARFAAAAPALWIARLLWRRDGSGRPGERLARALQDMGPSFIKLGQALSTRSDLLGEELSHDLSRLQDALPPFDGALARETVEIELGGPIGNFFERFDVKPVAAASIAQVHFATTADGRDVAVKILRPGIEDAFVRDIDFLKWIAEIIHSTQPAMRRLKPIEMVETFERTSIMELDLRFEAAACAELGENFADEPDFRVPEVDWTRTSQRVLTLERVAGIAVDEREQLVAAGIDPRKVLETSSRVFFLQVFRDGFFHADMHPGNVFVLPDGAIAPVDFGIMGRVDRRTQRFLAEMLVGFLTRDYKRVAEVHFAAGYVPAGQSKDDFAQAARSIAEPILGLPLSRISVARLLGQLFQVTETFRMEAQPQLLLLQKTMLTAEGTGRKLDPDVNMWELARPLIEKWMVENIGPEAKIRDTVENIARRAPRLLDNAEKAVATLAEQGIRMHPDTMNLMSRSRRSGIPWPIWVMAAVMAVLFFVR
ncbi:MAG: 2-polyprenylphenol 6-hydroxylase [Rhodospirillales bacterium]